MFWLVDNNAAMSEHVADFFTLATQHIALFSRVFLKLC